MATREIKATIAIDGTSKFNREIGTATRNLKTLQSGLKAETAELGKNATQQDKATVKAKSLREQIAQQRAIVDALTKAVEESTKEFGEASKTTDTYQQKLNAARATLAGMTTELQTAEEQSNALASTLGGAMITASNNAGKALTVMGATAGVAFAGIVAAAKSAVSSIDDLESQTADRADDLLTRSQRSGIGVVDLQAWEYAGRFIDTQVGTIEGSITKLRSTMTKKETGVDLATILGIDVRDENGLYKDAQQLFFEIANAASEGIKEGTIDPHSTEIGNLFQSLFGKSYEDLQPLLQNYEQWLEKVDEGKGLSMNEETVNAFGYLDDLQEKWDALRQSISETVAGFFLPDWTTLYENLDSVAGAFNSFLKGEDGSEEALGESIKKLFTDIADSVDKAGKAIDTAITDLQESDDENLRNIGDAFAAIRDAAVSIYDNKDKIAGVFGTLVGVWAAGKAITAANNLATFAGNVGALFTAIMKFTAPETAAAVEAMEAAQAAAGASGGATAAGAAGGGAGAMLGGAAGIVAAASAPFAIGAAILDAINKAGEEKTLARQSEITEQNAGRFAVEDPAAAAAAVKAYADAYAQQGAHMSGAEQVDWTEKLSDVLGSYDAALDVMEDIANGTVVGGDSFVVPDDWFTKIHGGVSKSVTEGLEDAGIAARIQAEINKQRYTMIVDPMIGGNFSAFTPHATGLLDVPYDGYPALLHKGETVLTRAQGDRFRTGNNIGGGISDKQMERLIAGITGAMSGLVVNMDGRAVGGMVAPTVSEILGREVYA